MGQGSQLEIYNATDKPLVLGSHGAYQMEHWADNLHNIEAFRYSKNFYIEFKEGIGVTYSDTNAFVNLSYNGTTVFHINASLDETDTKWQVYVKFLATNIDLAVGIIREGSLHDKKDHTSEWSLVTKNTTKHLGWPWKKAGDIRPMSLILLDLRLVFDGSDLATWRKNISGGNLSKDDANRLIDYSRAYMGLDLNFTREILGVEYDYPDMEKVLSNAKQKEIAIESNILIDKGATVDHGFTHTKQIQTSFYWHLTQSLAIGYKHETTIGVPETAATKTEWSGTLEFGAGQEWGSSEFDEYAISDTIHLSEGNWNIKGWVDYVDDLHIPFRFICRVSATAGDTKCPAFMLKTILEKSPYNHGFSGSCSIDSQYHVEATVSGECIGSYGVKRFLTATNALTGKVVFKK